MSLDFHQRLKLTSVACLELEQPANEETRLLRQRFSLVNHPRNVEGMCR